MSKPIRIDPAMLERAKIEGRMFRRSPPKQIEFWAEIGRQVSSLVDARDLFAVFTGAASVKITHNLSQPVSTTDVLAKLKADRSSGALRNSVTTAKATYGIDEDGRIRRTTADGRESLGDLVDGQFVQTSK